MQIAFPDEGYNWYFKHLFGEKNIEDYF